MSQIMTYEAWQRLRCAVRFHFRRWKYLAGHRFPDARDNELRDRGAALEFAANVIRNRRARDRRREAERLSAAREAWLQENVTS